MDETASEYRHGEQDVAQHVSMYHLFESLTRWGALHVAVLVLMFTLWFCLGVGFLGGLIPGVILMAVGIWFLRAKNPNKH